MHEMLHAVGFFHEQERPDRDDHVRINYENMLDDLKHNFHKQDPSGITTSGTPYDPKSIMHYGSYDFSKNGHETMVTITGESLGRGHRHGFSEIDKIEIERYYGCKKNGNNGTVTNKTLGSSTEDTKPVFSSIPQPRYLQMPTYTRRPWIKRRPWKIKMVV